MSGVAAKLRARGTEIVISPNQRAVVDKAEKALDALRPRRAYVRGRLLVHVVRDASAPEWLHRADAAPVIVKLEKERLREELGCAAKWLGKTKDGESYREIMVPKWVAATLTDRGEWIFPSLEGISDTPVLRPDGSCTPRQATTQRRG